MAHSRAARLSELRDRPGAPFRQDNVVSEAGEPEGTDAARRPAPDDDDRESQKAALRLKVRVALGFQEDLCRALLQDETEPLVSLDQELVARGSTHPVLYRPVGLRGEVRALRRPPLRIALQEVCLPRLGHEGRDVARLD